MNLVPIEFKNQRIMTTKVLAEQFGTLEDNITKNYSRNEERFLEGKHYYKLEGQALKDFKSSLPTESREPLKFAPVLYLWTDRGAARHAKILDTDEAWEVYEALEENYFNPRPKIEPLKLDSKFLFQLATQLEEKEKQIALMQPKADYFDELVERNLLTNFRDTAKELKVKQNEFIDWLISERYIYRDTKGKLKPYSQYTPSLFELKDWSRNGKADTQTLITPKGKETFRILLNN